MTPSRGTTLGGRYTLTDRVAVGGMGDVWAATDAVLGRTVAVKVMRPHPEPSFAARFRDEARHSAALSHPNIATVYDYGEDAGTAYLVMELVAGRPLSDLVTRGGIDPAVAQPIVGQAALALAAAHEAGVVHRDVKPANILLTPEGQVKLTDFGIAHAGDGASHTRTGEVIGTPQYLSPEQALGQPVTAATDLYSLGVVAFEMLTGRRPFDRGSAVATALAHVNDPAPALPATVPEPLNSAVTACLDKDPAHRPASAAALAASLGMPVSGVADTSPATSVIAVTDLGATQAMAPPTPTHVVTPALPPVLPPVLGAPVTIATDPVQPANPRGPTDRPRGSAWWWILPVLALLALAAFLLVQSRSSATPTPSATTSPPAVTVTQTQTTTRTVTATSTPATSAPTTPPAKKVNLKEADYVGRDVTAARNDLVTAGFPAGNVKVVEAADAAAAGTVLAVTPTGPTDTTATVTLTVSNGKGATGSASSG